jgi:hypothetical protein
MNKIKAPLKIKNKIKAKFWFSNRTQASKNMCINMNASTSV